MIHTSPSPLVQVLVRASKTLYEDCVDNLKYEEFFKGMYYSLTQWPRICLTDTVPVHTDTLTCVGGAQCGIV